MSGTTISQVQMIMGVSYDVSFFLHCPCWTVFGLSFAKLSQIQAFAGISEDLIPKEEF
jgi:hypothetical protein